MLTLEVYFWVGTMEHTQLRYFLVATTCKDLRFKSIPASSDLHRSNTVFTSCVTVLRAGHLPILLINLCGEHMRQKNVKGRSNKSEKLQDGRG